MQQHADRVIFIALVLASSSLLAAPHPTAVQSNHFAQSLVPLSDYLVRGRDVIVEETFAGYGGVINDLEFYREVTTRDRQTGRLISKILWERRNPEKLHGAEVYVYDKNGRLLREYQAMYSPYPDMDKAPHYTRITRHVYLDNLHVIREFDANGWPMFEICQGQFDEQQVSISYEYTESPDRPADIEDPKLRAAYQACFGNFPNRPGHYTNPLVEIQD